MAKTGKRRRAKSGPGDPGKSFGHGTNPLPPEDSERRCVATSKGSGKRCQNWAIRGGTVCRFHGGASGHVKRAAERRLQEADARATMESEVEREMITLGLPRDVEPAIAIMEELHRCAGHVAWLGTIVAQIDQDSITRGVSKIVRNPDGTQRTEVDAGVNIWVKIYQDERDRLARVAKIAIEAGIAERAVRVAEMQAEMMAGAIRRILERLGVADDPDAPVIVREELTRLGSSETVNGSATLVSSGGKH